MNQPFNLKHPKSFWADLSLGVGVFLLTGLFIAQAQSPIGGNVVSGNASILQTNSTLVTIQQTTPKAIIDWQSFSIGTGNTVKFVQPNSSSIALNRVTGNQVSQINGTLQANGQVWLLNPNGMLIGAGGQVNVGGFLGTTHSINNQQFVGGDYRFGDAGMSGVIANQGKIQIVNGGYAVLAGKAVRNQGLVQANFGQVVLGGAKQFTLDVVGDKLLSFAIAGDVDVLPQDRKALVDNAGTLQANGGRVTMTARAVRDVIDMVVNTSGLVQATRADMANGEIVLSAGDFGQNITGGTLNVSGKGRGETGGVIKVLGNKVTIAANAQLDATGDSGGGQIYVGGGWQGALVDGQNNALKTNVESGSVLDASALNTGNGGDVVVWAESSNPLSARTVAGTLLAKGGALSGVDGRVEPLNTSNTATTNPPPPTTTVPTSPPADTSTTPPTSTPPTTPTNLPADPSPNPPSTSNNPGNNGSSASASALKFFMQPQLLPPPRQPIGNPPPSPAGPQPVSSFERSPAQGPQGKAPPPPPRTGAEGAPLQEGRADFPPPPLGAEKPPRHHARTDAPPPPSGAEGPPRSEGRIEFPLPVMAKAPSPLPLAKPPTPRDTADSGDRTLNSVTPFAQPKPPANPKRLVVSVTAVAGSNLVQQQALPVRSSLTPGVETRFSGTANSVYW